MTSKISAILRVFNTYIFIISEKKQFSLRHRCIHGKHSLINLFGEQCAGLANLEYNVDLIGTMQMLKLLDKLEAEL